MKPQDCLPPEWPEQGAVAESHLWLGKGSWPRTGCRPPRGGGAGSLLGMGASPRFSFQISLCFSRPDREAHARAGRPTPPGLVTALLSSRPSSSAPQTAPRSPDDRSQGALEGPPLRGRQPGSSEVAHYQISDGKIDTLLIADMVAN